MHGNTKVKTVQYTSVDVCYRNSVAGSPLPGTLWPQSCKSAAFDTFQQRTTT